MGQKLIKKILIAIIEISFIISISCISNATNTESKKQLYINPDDYVKEETLLVPESLKAEEKIMEYDIYTGETKEVDMNQVKQNLAIFNQKQGNVEINELQAYNPYGVINPTSLINNMRTTITRVANPTQFPYVATCRLKYDVYGLEGVSSGALVGSNILLTTAHCVMNREDGDAFFADWNAYPGYNNGVYNGLGCGWTKVYYSNLWKQTHAIEYDWCLCVLGQPLGSSVGYWGVRSYNNSASLTGSIVTGYGYPTDIGEGKYQCNVMGVVGNVQNGYFIADNAVALGGMSGGPMNYGVDGNIVGIIKAGNGVSTQCVRITGDIFDLIQDNR